MKRLLLLFTGILISFTAFSQCTTTNGTSCVCPTAGATDCDLLPDIVISRDAITNTGGYTEYPQYSAGTSQASQGADDGRLRVNGSTPNIGFGPIEVRGVNKWVCGTDTFTTYPGAGGCPGGSDPKQILNQRIYHKNGTLMQYSDRLAGTMTYHPSHGHQHIDDWGVYTLRLQDPNQPDPTKWSIVGRGSKLAYCLLDLSSCNTSTGYCRDSNNTVLNSTNLPNYGLGGGAYGCSNTLQGISAGYVDTYSKSLDGMWVNIPLGTCNGNYYIVIEVDPRKNFREQNENNNVMAVPVTLTRQNAPGTGVAQIIADRPSMIVSGDSVTLTANAGFSYLWSTGATSQSIRVGASGSYSVTVTGPCGTATSSAFAVNVVAVNGAADPTTTSATRCGTGSVTLTASGSGTIRWYGVPSGGTPIFTGNSFTTPSLGVTTTYYAENVEGIIQPVNSVGPAANTIGTGAYYTGTTTQYQVFDAYSAFTLQSVRVYAGTTASRTFILYDKDMSTVRSTTVSVPAGSSVVNLNWNIPAGDFYRLQVTGAANLYYNTSGVTYPYTVPGILQIHNSSGGHNNFYYCYDWKVKAADIVSVSGRVPATATITAGPAVSFSGLSASYAVTAAPVTLTGSPSGGIFSGPGISGNTFSPSVAGVGGPYTITYNYSDANNCSGNQSQTTTVTSSYNCGVPTGLTATNIKTTTARINWTYATAPTFRLRYRRVGSTTYSYKTFTYTQGVNNYLLTGLRKNTSYEVALQTTCTSGSSAFSTTLTFRTASSGLRLANGTTVSSDSEKCILYPNPATNLIYFACDQEEDLTQVDFEVYDVVGKQIMKGNNATGQLDISSMSPGTYLLKVITPDSIESMRFIKE